MDVSLRCGRYLWSQRTNNSGIKNTNTVLPCCMYIVTMAFLFVLLHMLKLSIVGYCFHSSNKLQRITGVPQVMVHTGKGISQSLYFCCYYGLHLYGIVFISVNKLVLFLSSSTGIHRVLPPLMNSSARCLMEEIFVGIRSKARRRLFKRSGSSGR